ncbi:PEP-CTERM sorting domain-containing protein [Trichloromonas sp.]|uniref:PEP-CTERM sorting domain-containing protein n=1 Tax=Trichloromonas sp. TaxID=3069249 RepID=UPI003D817B24
MKTLIVTAVLALITSPAWATTWMIGDDDGYGIGIPDNANHTFVTPIKDFRSAAEAAATNGAQFTDTYSTTHPGFSPQPGTVATFSFTGLGSGWTEGSMWFDMADFQASTFGPVSVTYNGIVQNWAFNDGYPSTMVRFFDLDQNVLDSINLTGILDVVIDRNQSSDFYGFDYALLSDRTGANTTNVVPEPSTFALLGAGLAGMMVWRKKKRS